MPSYPNMILEIFDAIDIAFANEPDIKADCLVYLMSLQHDDERVINLGVKASKVLDEMNRCNICGKELKSITYKEPHPELDGCPMEEMTEVYCPNCDIVPSVMLRKRGLLI